MRQHLEYSTTSMSAQLLDFNYAVALERVGGDVELLREVIELFRIECPQLVEHVELAVADADPGSLERAAHTLKGSLSTIGAEFAAQAALRLEVLGRSGSTHGAADGLVHLHRAITRLCQELDSATRN